MADINQVISLGIGTPADIPHFLLVGLSPAGGAATAHPDGAGCTAGAGPCTATGGGAAATGGWTGGDATPGYERGRSEGWINRDYVRKPLPKRITRVKGHAQPRGAGCVSGAGRVRAQGVQARVVAARARPAGAGTVVASGAAIGQAAGLARVSVRTVAAKARVQTKAMRPLTSEEWFLLSLALREDV